MEGMDKEGEDIRKLFNLDCGRFAKTVAGFGLDTDQDRCISTLTGL
jgi:hypothetical protein